MKVALASISAAVVLVAGVGGYFGWNEYQQRQAARAAYQSQLAAIERLLADAYEPPDRAPDAEALLRRYGCQRAWIEAPQTAGVRYAKAEALATTDAVFLTQLRQDTSASASYVLATLLHKTAIRQRAELAGIDPEALLRRAAAGGHGHARYYFLRLLAESHPHTLTPSSERDVGNFQDLNRQLERAADAGSGAAAYLLALRTDDAVLARFASYAHDDGQLGASRSRILDQRDADLSDSSRTARAWSCRSAQLGYAPGQLQCYRLGGKRTDEARALLLAAADGGHELANAAVAAHYSRGDGGFARDAKKQREFLCRALALGERQAGKALRRLDRRQGKAAPAARTAH